MLGRRGSSASGGSKGGGDLNQRGRQRGSGRKIRAERKGWAAPEVGGGGVTTKVGGAAPEVGVGAGWWVGDWGVRVDVVVGGGEVGGGGI